MTTRRRHPRRDTRSHRRARLTDAPAAALTVAVSAALAAGAWAAAGPARAQTAAAAGAHSSAQLLPGWLDADGARMAGLAIDLAPGWRTYWRAPGETGAPPRFDWSGSRNVAGVEVIWPRPAVFESGGYSTVGYTGSVALPLRVTPGDPARPVDLRLRLDYGVCAEICTMQTADLALDIPPSLTGGRTEIAAALTRRPAGASELRAGGCEVRGAGETRRFEAALTIDPPFRTPPHVVVEGPEAAWFRDATATLDGDTVRASAEVSVLDPELWIGRDDLRVTLITDDRMVELPGCAPRG